MAQQPTTVFVSQGPSRGSPILASGSRHPEPGWPGVSQEARDASIPLSIPTTSTRGRGGSLTIWIEEHNTASGVHPLTMCSRTVRRRLPEPPSESLANPVPASAPPRIEKTQGLCVVRPLPSVPQTSSTLHRSVPPASSSANSSTPVPQTITQLERASTFSGAQPETNKNQILKPRRPLPVPVLVKVEPLRVKRRANTLPSLPLPPSSRSLPPLPSVLSRVDEDTHELSQDGENPQEQEDFNLLYDRISKGLGPTDYNLPKAFTDDEDTSPAALHRRLVIPNFPSISKNRLVHGSNSKALEKPDVRNVFGGGRLAIEVWVGENFKSKEGGWHIDSERHVDYTWLLSNERLRPGDIHPGHDHEYSSKWVREKKGRRITEQDFNDIVQTLRCL